MIILIDLIAILSKIDFVAIKSNWHSPDIQVRSYFKLLYFGYYLLFEKPLLIVLTLLPLFIIIYFTNGSISILIDFITDKILFSTPKTYSDNELRFRNKYDLQFGRKILLSSAVLIFVFCIIYFIRNSSKEISLGELFGFIWGNLLYFVLIFYIIISLALLSLRKKDPSKFDYTFFSDISLRNNFRGIIKFLFTLGLIITIVFHLYINFIINFSNSLVINETNRFSNYSLSLNSDIHNQFKKDSHIHLDAKVFNNSILEENKNQNSLLETVNIKILTDKIYLVSIVLFLLEFLKITIGRYFISKNRNMYKSHLFKIGLSILKSFFPPIIIFLIIKYLYKIDISDPFSFGIMLSFIITMTYIIEDLRTRK